MFRFAPLAAIAALLLTSGAVAQTESNVWIGPAAGDWSDGANWSTGVAPAGGDAAHIDADPAQDSHITSTGFRSVGELVIDAGDTLTTDDFGASWIQTAGDLIVTPGNSLTVNGPLFIEPTGRLRLSPGAATPGAEMTELLGGIPGQFRWNRGTIEGGRLVRSTGNFFNEGEIRADSSFMPLEFDTFGSFVTEFLTNPGIARATGGGELRLKSFSGPAVIVNHFGGSQGRIEAGAGSTVTLDRVTLVGGTLAALPDETSPGQVNVVNATLSGVTIEGTVNATSSTLAGTINNVGTLHVNQSLLIANETTELTGGGTVRLADPEVGGFPSQIFAFNSDGPPYTPPFINQDNLIQGRGRLSLQYGQFVNRGVIETGYGDEEIAAPPLRELDFSNYSGQSLTNSGTIRATAGNRVTLTTPVVNFEPSGVGVIEALPGGTVQLGSGRISGGVLRAVPAPLDASLPAGLIVSYQPASLADLRLEGAIGGAASRFLVSGQIDANGSLEVNQLTLRSDTTFRGGEVIIGRTGGALVADPPSSSNQQLRLTLDGATLRVFDGNSSSPRGLSIDNRGAIVGSAGAQFSFSSSQTVINQGLIHAEAATRTRNGSPFFQVGCGEIAQLYNWQFSLANSRGAIRLSPPSSAISGQDSLA